MLTLRLLADDLTGALDTAAEFVPVTGDLPVFWRNRRGLRLPASAAVDSGTRERDAVDAIQRTGELVRLLEGAEMAFKKIDSLLRGPTLAELAACMRAGIWRHCALAPAFPYHGRVTRRSRQYANVAGALTPVSDDLVAALRSLGVPAQAGDPDGVLQPGISVFDAATDGDLQRIVAAVQRCAAPVLWAGTGGLAQVLSSGHPHPAATPLPGPLLGMFGSDQPTTTAQLAACGPHWLRVKAFESAAISTRLGEAGVALISFDIPDGTSRASAAAHIAGEIERLIDRIRSPGTVIVAGGETLRSLCDALGTDRLLVRGRIVPGVPRSVMIGGRWNGITVVSKSGAFGHPTLLSELILERTAT